MAAVYFYVVWGRTIPRLYMTAITAGLSAVFAGASSRNILYNGGVICGPSSHTMLALSSIPQLVYVLIGLLLQLLTSIYVTKTLVQVSSNLSKSRNSQGGDEVEHTRSQKAQLVLIAYIKSFKLLWRTYVSFLFMCMTIVFATVSYIVVVQKRGSANDRLATGKWIHCIMQGGSIDSCADYTFGEGIYTRTLLGMILMAISALVLLLTEIRPFLFTGWWRLLKSPSSLFSRNKSNIILDTLTDFTQTPEKIQTRFLNFEVTTKNRDFELQLDSYVTAQQNHNYQHDNTKKFINHKNTNKNDTTNENKPGTPETTSRRLSKPLDPLTVDAGDNQHSYSYHQVKKPAPVKFNSPWRANISPTTPESQYMKGVKHQVVHVDSDLGSQSTGNVLLDSRNSNSIKSFWSKLWFWKRDNDINSESFVESAGDGAELGLDRLKTTMSTRLFSSLRRPSKETSSPGINKNDPMIVLMNEMTIEEPNDEQDMDIFQFLMFGRK